MATIEIFGTTDVGQAREHNEDNFVICKNLDAKEWNFKRDEKLTLADGGALLVVADGMGGANAGEVASHLAQETVKAAFDNLASIPASDKEREKLLKTTIRQAHDNIVAHQQAHLETAGMGTTLVIAWAIKDKLHVGWCGDSRCYVFRGEANLYPFTDDHSLVWNLVKDGEITPEEAREHPESNIITQSLGDPSNTPQPSAKTTQLYKGDKVLVCSDGLNGMLSDAQIRHYLCQEEPVAEICKSLTQAANQAGGTDNITTLMLEVLEGKPAPANVSSASGKSSTTKSPTPPTNTQILRSRISAKNYLLAGAGLIMVALLGWIFFNQNNPATEGNRTVINVNGKSYEYTAGELQQLDLVALITESQMILDSFYLDGLKYTEDGGNGKIRFLLEGADDHKVKVKLFPQTRDTVYIANLTLRAKARQPTPPPSNEELDSGANDIRNETASPAEESPSDPPSTPEDTLTNELEESTVEEPKPADTTGQSPPPDTSETSKPAPPELNPIQEEPDTTGL